MRTKLKLNILAALSAVSFLGATAAARSQETSTIDSLKPIVVKWRTVGGMNYFLSGKKVNDYKGLEAIINSLDDSEATRLLKKSEDDNRVGMVGIFGGLGLMAGGVFASTLDAANHNWVWDGIDTETALLVGGGLVIHVIGGLIWDESVTTKFAAVERYNQVVRHESDLSVFVPLQTHRAGLSLALKF